MAIKVAFFDSKPYDEASFKKANEKYGSDIRFYKGHLNKNNVVLSKGAVTRRGAGKGLGPQRAACWSYRLRKSR